MTIEQRLKEKFEKWFYLTGSKANAQEIADWWLLQIKEREQELLDAGEGLKKEYPSTDFNDGGDPEYRERRETIDSRVTSAHNSAIEAYQRAIQEIR